MRLLYIGCCQFQEKDDGLYALPAYGDFFWDKYLDVFDEVKVLGEPMKKFLDANGVVKITDERIKVEILPANTHPKDFKNDHVIKKKLSEEISKSEAILIKPSSRKGIIAIKIAQKMGKPYMIDITGDVHNTLRLSKSFLKRIYAPVLYRQIKNAIKNCKYALYVSEKYLQRKYPINGIMCGCSDVAIKSVNNEILDKRIIKVLGKKEKNNFSIGLIGFYQDDRKGIDTAIKALSDLNDNIELYILGNGTEEDRRKWLSYADVFGVKGRINFPDLCKSTEDVLCWIETMDLIILPSRSEGLPRCIVEAMSVGCPCITSDVCGLPELVEKKWLHSPEDAERLTFLIKKMLHNKEAMIESAKTNFERAKDFQFDVLRERRNKFLCEFRKYCMEEKK